MRAPSEDGALRWTAISIPNGPRASQASTKRPKSATKEMVKTAVPEPSAEEANAALSRIEMPADAMERIAELLTPGSSLIVTDYGMSNESGTDTDFIVETR